METRSRWFGLMLVIVLAACGSPVEPSPSIPAGGSPSQGPTASAIAPTPVPTASASASIVSAPPTPAITPSPSIAPSWQAVVDPVFDGGVINDVVAGTTGFVAVGSVGGPDPKPRRAAVWTSPDGRAWTLVPDGAAFRERFRWGMGLPSSGGMLAVTRWSKGYVVVGGAGSGWARAHAAVWTSPNGSTWTRVADQAALADSYMVDVTAGPAGLVAVGVTGVHLTRPTAAAWTSSDGRHWRRAIVGGASRAFLSAVVRANGRFWALGAPTIGQCSNCPQGGRTFWSSSDGRSWTRLATFGLPPVDELPPTHLLSTGTGLVAYGALGDRPAGWWSTDGVTLWPSDVQPWAPAAGSVGLQAAAQLGERWVAVGIRLAGEDSAPAQLLAWSTPNGMQWDPIPLVDPAGGVPDGMSITAAAGGNGVVVVGGYSDSGDGTTTARIILFSSFPTP